MPEVALAFWTILMYNRLIGSVTMFIIPHKLQFVKSFSQICKKISESKGERTKMSKLLEVIIARLRKMSPEQLMEIYTYIRRMK